MPQPTGFLNNQSGATAIEYCLIAGLISITILTALTAIGPKLQTFFQAISQILS